jgi:ABC-type uncharacterized transport system YnjBCD substrate-binding protein
MRRTIVWVVLVAFLLTSAAALAADILTVAGKVTFACPQGNALKVKNVNGEVMLWVNPNCPHKAGLQAQIKALKVGNHVRCRYYNAQAGKNYVTKITVLR